MNRTSPLISDARRGRGISKPLVIASVAAVALIVFALVSSLSSHDDRTRIEDLRKAGNVKALGELARTGDEKVSTLAIRALGRCGQAAGDELRGLMSDKRPGIRAKAAVALACAAPAPSAADLTGMLARDAEPAVRAAAARALGRMAAFEELDALLEGLNDADRSVREASAAAIHEITGMDFVFPLGDDESAGRQKQIALARRLLPAIKARHRADRDKR